MFNSLSQVCAVRVELIVSSLFLSSPLDDDLRTPFWMNPDEKRRHADWQTRNYETKKRTKMCSDETPCRKEASFLTSSSSSPRHVRNTTERKNSPSSHMITETDYPFTSCGWRRCSDVVCCTVLISTHPTL